MTITTLNGLVAGLASGADRVLIDKASQANQTIGRFCSLWRAAGIPAQAAIPTTTADLCESIDLGALGFTNQTAPATSYLAWMYLAAGNSTVALEVHDRLIQMGGLVLNVATAQNITGLGLDTLSVPAERLGAADYSDVQWWLEVYADGGATASNATINVTFNDNTSANLNTLAVGGTIRIGNMFSLDALKTTAQQSLYIKRVNSVTLSASTGTVGNFGITATRPRTICTTILANKQETFDWQALGLPEIVNGSCLMLMTLCITTSSGTWRGGGKIIHG